jgi:hypothetical protein
MEGFGYGHEPADLFIRRNRNLQRPKGTFADLKKSCAIGGSDNRIVIPAGPTQHIVVR